MSGSLEVGELGQFEFGEIHFGGVDMMEARHIHHVLGIYGYLTDEQTGSFVYEIETTAEFGYEVSEFEAGFAYRTDTATGEFIVDRSGESE